MKTRKSFLDWVTTLNNPVTSKINQSSFLSINEKDYVFDILEQLQDQYVDLKPILADYSHLERQRYAIFEKSRINEDLAMKHMAAAIEFCSKPDEKKRQGIFKMNLSISNWLVETSYWWEDAVISALEPTPTSYLLIPSFLSIAPKEICLTGLNALLLDIMNYEKEFAYQELYELVNTSLTITEDKLDSIFLEYIENQILYYGTIVPSD